MSKKLKIILTFTTLTVLTMVFLIFNGLHLMTIEDHYGDNKNFYFYSKQGDIIINKTQRELRVLEKSKNRIFFVENGDATDLYHLMVDNEIEIYRSKTDMRGLTTLKLEDLDSLIKKGDLELVIKN